jgi:hypothetical protein
MIQKFSNAAAYALLERIAEKAGEIFGNATPEKTIGQWRAERAELTTEALFFVARRRAVEDTDLAGEEHQVDAGDDADPLNPPIEHEREGWCT